MPALMPSPLPPGRPPKSKRAIEFETRCVLAFEAWRTVDNDQSKALRRVLSVAEATAEWLGVSGKGGFDRKTILNWHQRHQTHWNRWRTHGRWPDTDTPDDLSRRHQLELVKVISGFDGDPIGDWTGVRGSPTPPDDEKTWLHHLGLHLLDSLNEDKIDRPMFVTGRCVVL